MYNILSIKSEFNSPGQILTQEECEGLIPWSFKTKEITSNTDKALTQIS